MSNNGLQELPKERSRAHEGVRTVVSATTRLTTSQISQHFRAMAVTGMLRSSPNSHEKMGCTKYHLRWQKSNLLIFRKTQWWQYILIYIDIHVQVRMPRLRLWRRSTRANDFTVTCHTHGHTKHTQFLR